MTPYFLLDEGQKLHMVHTALDLLAPACSSTLVPSKSLILQYRIKKGHSLLLHKLLFPSFFPIVSPFPLRRTPIHLARPCLNVPSLKAFPDSSSLSFMRAESSV